MEGGGKSIIIAGRGDYVITMVQQASGRPVSRVDYIDHILCVVGVQSNVKMFAYLFILMNVKGLMSLLGFLVYRNEMCRAYRATRNVVEGFVYEQNDRFHVSNIAEVFGQQISELL